MDEGVGVGVCEDESAKDKVGEPEEEKDGERMEKTVEEDEIEGD